MSCHLLRWNDFKRKWEAPDKGHHAYYQEGWSQPCRQINTYVSMKSLLAAPTCVGIRSHGTNLVTYQLSGKNKKIVCPPPVMLQILQIFRTIFMRRVTIVTYMLYCVILSSTMLCIHYSYVIMVLSLLLLLYYTYWYWIIYLYYWVLLSSLICMLLYVV